MSGAKKSKRIIEDDIQPAYKPNYNIVSYYKLLQQGGISSRSYSRLVATHRSSNLVLNKYRDIEQKHVNGINSLDLDPAEGRYLLSGCSEGGVAIHDLHVNKRHMKHTCPIVHYKRRCFYESCRSRAFREGGHTHSVETVQWYPLDSGIFTTSSHDKSVKVWDANTMTVADCYNMSEVVYAHHMCASHRTLIAVGSKEHKVTLIDVNSGSKCHTLRAHRGKVMCVQWSPRQEGGAPLLATGSADQHIYIWDVRSARGPLINCDRYKSAGGGQKSSEPASRDLVQQQRVKAHSAPVTGLQYTGDGLHLLSFGQDYKLRLWDADTGHNTNVNYGQQVMNYSRRKVQMAVTRGLVQDVVYVPTQQVVSVYGLWTGRRAGRLVGHFNDVQCVAWDGRGEQEVYSGGNDRNLLVWSCEGAGDRAGRAECDGVAPGAHLQDEWSDDDDLATSDVINGRVQQEDDVQLDHWEHRY